MTTPAAMCLLLTCDPQFSEYLARAVGGLADIRATSSRMQWSREQSVPAVRLLELRHP